VVSIDRTSLIVITKTADAPMRFKLNLRSITIGDDDPAPVEPVEPVPAPTATPAA
jgi:hypothetical protein